MKNNGRHAIHPALRKNLYLKYVRMMMRNAKRERSPASSLMMNGKNAIPMLKNNWLNAKKTMMNAKREAMRSC